MLNSFVLDAYASSIAWRTLLKQLLACVNVPLDSEDLGTNEKIDFHELWQQLKNYGDE